MKLPNVPWKNIAAIGAGPVRSESCHLVKML